MTTDGILPPHVRERLVELGERYGATPATGRPSAAADDGPAGTLSAAETSTGTATPEHSDAVIRDNTGHSWQHWREVIDAWPGHDQGHSAVAAWLQQEHDVPGWWAQAITVGWERLTGRRLPHQMADGTFTANRSATITADRPVLAELLRDEDAHALLFPGLAPQLRSRVTSKTVRIALVSGVAELSLASKDDRRVTVTIGHAKLPGSADVEHWRSFWGEWLATLDGVTADPA
jgi:hypothetical protein